MLRCKDSGLEKGSEIETEEGSTWRLKGYRGRVAVLVS
jgi:hypothetical protein